jgi:hypothetical protein
MRLALDEALSSRLATDSARTDGARFLAAMQQISFDLEAFDPFSLRSHVSGDSSTLAVDALLRSITSAQAAA